MVNYDPGLGGRHPVLLSNILDGDHGVQNRKGCLFARSDFHSDPGVIRGRFCSEQLLPVRVELDSNLLWLDDLVLYPRNSRRLPNGVLPNGEIAVDTAVDVIDEDDAGSRRPNSDLHPLAEDGFAR